MKNITITVRAFSIVTDAIGKSEFELTLPEGSHTEDALNTIVAMNPSKLEKMPIRLALNHEYVLENQPLNNKDELALIPPVSGG